MGGASPRHRRAWHFPNTERIWQGTVSLPVYPGLTNDELAYICQTIHDLLS